MFRCHDCKRKTFDYYMLRDKVWHAITKGKIINHLCFECAQKRLGRKLRKRDFADLPINYISFRLPLKEASLETRKICLSWWEEVGTEVLRWKKFS